MTFPIFANEIIISCPQNNLETLPNAVVTFSLNFKNQSHQLITTNSQIDLPDAWKIITQPSNFQIPAQQEVTKLVSVQIPKNTLSGTHTIHIQVQTVDGKPLAIHNIPIKVKSEQRITLTALQSPDFVLAGESVSIGFMVSNDGNQVENIQLSSHNCKIISETRLRLSPGFSKIIKVKATGDENLSKIARKSFSVIVNSGGETIAQRYQHFNVIPTGRSTTIDYRHLHGQASLTYLGRDYQPESYLSSYQGSLLIKGKLDSAETQDLEIGLRKSNQSDNAVFGLQDEYYATLSTPEASIFVGDKTYALSPLTEFGRYARGAEVNFNQQAFTFGGFYQRPRFFPGLEREIAGYVTYRDQSKNDWSLNYLHKSFNENGDSTSASIVSLANEIRSIKNTVITNDVAYTLQGGWGFYSNLFSQPVSPLQINVTLLYASRDFKGYYHNTQNVSGNINYALNRQISVSASLSQDERNTAQDTLLNYAPYAQYWQIGTSFRMDEHTQFRLYYQKQEIEDRLPDKLFHRAEAVTRLFINQNYKKLNWTILNEFGHTQNLSQGNTTPLANLYRGQVDIQFRPHPKHSIQLFSQFFLAKSLEDTDQQLIYGLGIRSHLTKSTRLSFNIQNKFRPDEYYRDRNLMELRLQQQIHRQHRISISSRYALLRGSLDDRQFSVIAGYHYDFHIPLEERKKGRNIYIELHNKGAKKLSGIIFTLNGMTAITDDFGKAVFRKVPRGAHFLLLNAGTLGKGDIITTKMPLLLNMPPERDTVIRMDVTRAAKIEGRVLFETEQSSRMNFSEEQYALSNTLLELTNGLEKVQLLTNQRGEFTFRNLCPGKWELRVVTNKKDILFPKESVKMELKSGQRMEIIIPVKRKRRQIKFQESLSISSGSKD